MEDTCVRCNRTVYKMEEVIAEQQVWHKNCFRCKQCDKPLNRHSKVDSFQIHEGVVYCKVHFKQLFGPNDDAPKRKPELIIRENQPTELPDSVVRSSDRNDLGLDDIETAAVKTRFEMFEKIATTKEVPEELQHNVGLKRSATVLSKMKKFHAKGWDVGMSDDKNGKQFNDDDDSIHSEDYDEDADIDLIRAQHAQRERPLIVDNMNEIKNKFETGMEKGRAARHEERKQEIQDIRSRLFWGKQARTKEMYQNAVAELDTTTKLRNKVSTVHELDNVKAAAQKSQNIKQRFETGDIYQKSSNADEDEEYDQVKQQRQQGNASKGQVSNKVSERMQMLARQQAHDQLIKSHAKVKNVEKADISNQYEFFENYNPDDHKLVKQANSAYDDENAAHQDIKIDGIRIDSLKIDGLVDKAKSSYIDQVKRSETMKKNQGTQNVADTRNGKNVEATTQNQPNPAALKSLKSSGPEQNRRLNDKSESEMSSRQPEYLDSDMEVTDRTSDLIDRFEQWNYENNNVFDIAEYNDSVPEYDEIDESQTETTKTIRAKFEKLPHIGKIQNTKQSNVNRFVD